MLKTDVIKHWNKKQKPREWSLNKFKKAKKEFSKLLSRNCAGWNPIKLGKYKQYPYIIKMKESNWMILKIQGENEWLQKFWFKRSF